MSPVGKTCTMHEITPAITPTLTNSFPNSSCRFCSKYNAPVAATTNEAVTTAPHSLCAYWIHAHGFSRSPVKLVSSNLPFESMRYATGCCIHASVTMMKNPEIHEPVQTMKVAPKCSHFESRFSPKRNSPRNVDSRKKEKTPSMARGCPMIPPVRRENSDQFVQN